MEKIGIFFGSLSGNTRIVAELIQDKLPKNGADIFDVFECDHSQIKNYKNLIFGVPTWGKLILHDDWQTFLKNVSQIEFRDKKIALFGLGDQTMFKDAFVDAMGVVYEKLMDLGCEIIGTWPAKGYDFTKSNAMVDDHFCGLVIDEDNQSDLTENRVEEWVEEIQSKFY